MDMITSRQNPHIALLRALGRDGGRRRALGRFVLDGEKLLREAVGAGAAVESVLWTEGTDFPVPCPSQYASPRELVEYASPVIESPGPVFTVRIPEGNGPGPIGRAIVLESVQDPGNVGTVVRTADALGVDTVILTGECADLYSPKTARATMGAVFRQRVLECPLEDLPALLRPEGIPLYGAALDAGAADIRDLDLGRCAVAVGNEGRGLSARLLELCEKKLIIPIAPASESLNAAMAATLIMWEMVRR